MILVTGGTGLLGSHLIFRLAKQQLRVRVLKRPGSDISKVKRIFSIYDNEPDRYLKNLEFVDGDLLDIQSIDDALSGVSQVYHCAAMVSFHPVDQRNLVHVNERGTANLVNACLARRGIRFCHVSSIATLVSAKQGEILTESSFWKSSKRHSVYAISKFAAEREVWRAAEEGLDMFVVNPSVILGPGNWKTDSSRLFGMINKGMYFHTNGTTGYTDVRDVAEIMIRLMNHGIKGDRFIVSAENLTYQQVFSMIAQALNKKKPFIKLSPIAVQLAWRVFYPLQWFGIQPLATREIARTAFNRSTYDNSKIKNLIDYQFIPISQSIIDTAGIFLKEQQPTKSS